MICARAYHALFMVSNFTIPVNTSDRPPQHNMLIRPTEEQLADFGEPDFIIYNAGQFPANRFTKGMSSTTSVEINFKRMEMVILGTEYAGEMKKGVFSVMVCRLYKFGKYFLILVFIALSPTCQIWPTFPPLVFQCWQGKG